MSKELQKSNTNLKQTRNKNPLSQAGGHLKGLKLSLDGLELPRLFYQQVIFVLDGSGSMTYEGMSGKTKGKEIEEAIQAIIKRLKSSKNKASFDITMFAYSKKTVEMLSLCPVKNIDANGNFDPCDFVDNQTTYIEDALAKSEEQALNYLREHHDKNTQVLIILLSDGALHDQAEAQRISNRLKLNDKITVASYLFEDKQWKAQVSDSKLTELRENLRSLSSTTDTDPNQFFKSTVDAEEIRKHMIKSISTVSKIQNP